MHKVTASSLSERKLRGKVVRKGIDAVKHLGKGIIFAVKGDGRLDFCCPRYSVLPPHTWSRFQGKRSIKTGTPLGKNFRSPIQIHCAGARYDRANVSKQGSDPRRQKEGDGDDDHVRDVDERRVPADKADARIPRAVQRGERVFCGGMVNEPPDRPADEG